MDDFDLIPWRDPTMVSLCVSLFVSISLWLSLCVRLYVCVSEAASLQECAVVSSCNRTGRLRQVGDDLPYLSDNELLVSRVNSRLTASFERAPSLHSIVRQYYKRE